MNKPAEPNSFRTGPDEQGMFGIFGGRFVAETIVGILLQDDSSYLARDPLWTPSLAVKGRFGLRELIAAALS